MAMDSVALQSWLLDHAATVVGTAATLAFEPRSRLIYTAAGPTVVAGWLGRIAALPTHGGLATTAGRVQWTLQVYRNAIGDPAAMAATERALLTAIDAILAAYFGDIGIGSTGAWFDPKGQTGDAIAAELAYLTIDNQQNRVATITVGVVQDDAWGEAL